MLIDNRQFSGERPKISARNLGINEAQLALDCTIVSHELRAMMTNAFSTSIAISNPLTIFLSNDEWVAFPEVVSAIGDSLNSSQSRIFWTSASSPPQQATLEQLNAGQSFEMGVPKPNAPNLGTLNGPEVDIATTSFFVTSFVNGFGEEGDKSDPSPLFDYFDGQDISVTNIGETNNPGVSETNNVVAQRIYLQVEGVPRFVAEVPITDTQYPVAGAPPFVISEFDFGEAFTSEDFFAPPADMQGLHLMANGVAAGFSGRTVYLSEAFLPNAWPYSFEVSDDIAALSSFDNNLVILTDGYPEVAAILDPSNVSSAILADREPCVSARSVVQGAGGVIYATPSVLYFIGAGGGRALTEDYFDDTDWREYRPETFNSVFRDGQYIAFHDSLDKEGRGLVFDMRESNAVATQISDWTPAAHVRNGTNELYLVDGTDILLYQGGSERRTYTWRSKMHGGGSPFALTAYRILSCDFQDDFEAFAADLEELTAAIIAEHEATFAFYDSLPEIYGLGGGINGFTLAGAGIETELAGQPIPPGVSATCGSAVGSGTAGNARTMISLGDVQVTLEVFKDKELIDTIVINSDDPDRIEYADRGRLWEYQVRGSIDVTQVSLAGSRGELYNGS